MEGPRQGAADGAVLPHAAPELPELEDGYEQQLDVLRERTLLAERTAASRLPSWSGCAATFP